MTIIDKLNEVGNNYSISTDELASGLQRSSSTLSLMGNTIDEAAALITAGNATIQNAESVAAGIKTISLRLVGTEEAEEQLKVDGEDVEDAFIQMTQSKKQKIIKDYTAVAANNYQGFDILDESGNYKNTYEILLGISKVYKDIQEEDKKFGTNRANALIEELAGKNRSNIVSAILQNGEMLEAVKASSEEASGSAMRENEKYLDSVEGRISQLRTGVEEFWNKAINADDLKYIIQALTGMLDIVNQIVGQIGSIPTLLSVASPFLLNQTDLSLFKYGKLRDEEGNPILEDGKEQYGYQGVLHDIFEGFKGGIQGSDEVTGDLDEIADSAGDVILESEGLKSAFSSLSPTFSALGNVAKALIASFVEMAAVMAIFFAVSKIIEGIDILINGDQKLIESGKQAAESISETYDTYNNKVSSIKSASEVLSEDTSAIVSTSEAIDSLAQKYIELSQGVNSFDNSNINLSNEEYQTFLDTSNQLAEVLPELVTKYDENGNAMLNLGNNATEASEKIKEAVEQQQLLAHYEIVDQATTQMKSIQEQDRLYGRDKSASNQNIKDINENIKYLKGDVAKNIYKDNDVDRLRRITELYRQLKEEKAQNASLDKMVEDNYKSFIPTIQGLLETTSEFSNLDATIQEKLLESIKGLDGKQISSMLKDADGDVFKLSAHLSQAYIEPFEKIEKEGLTDRLLGLFDLDSSKLTVNDYLVKINDELSTIFAHDKSQIPLWKNILGIDDLVDQQTQVHNILSDTTDSLEVTASQFDSLTMSDRDIAYDLIVNEKFEGTFDELKERIEETRKELNNPYNLEVTPLLDKYNKAVQDATDNGNQGKNYDAYGAALKSLKEQYDKGLIGTETFKQGARMFSFGGATDPDNFIENYERMAKFWNEENPSEGIDEFVNEMKKLDLMEETDDGGVVTKFDNIAEAANKAKMPLELFVAMFNKMEEFGSKNDFFTTADDGFQTIGEISGELAAARAEYQELLDTQPKNKSAIEAKKKEIEELEDRLGNAQEDLTKFLDKGGLEEYTKNYKEQRQSAKDALSDLNNSDVYKRADEDQKRIMLEAVRSGFEKSGLDSSMYEKLGIDKTGKIVLDVQARNDRIDKILEAYVNPKTRGKEFDGKTAEEIVNKWASDLGMSVFDYFEKVNNGEFELPQSEEQAETVENTSALHGLTSAINMATGKVDAILGVLGVDGKDKDESGKESKKEPETPIGVNKAEEYNDRIDKDNVNRPTYTKADAYDDRINEEEINRKGASAAGEFVKGFVDFLTGGPSQVNAAEVPDDYIRQTSNKDFNFTTRKRIGSEDMRYNGWKADEGSYATVNTVGHTDPNTGKEYVVTPILPNGDVLDPDGLDKYMDSIFAGGTDTDNLVISTFEGKNARKAANDYAAALHEVHQAYYSTDQAAKTAIESLQGYSEEELRSIDLTDDSTSEMEEQFVSLMDSMNLSSDQAEQFINVLRDMGLIKVQPQVDVSGLDKVKSVEELNSKLSGELEVGQSVTYTANVENAEQEVKAVEDQEGHITYYAENLEGVEKEVEPVANKKGEITYKVKTEGEKNSNKKTKKDGGTITTKTDMDTKSFDQKTNQVESKIRKVDGQRANPHVSLSGAGTVSSQLSSISSKITSLDGKTAKVILTTVKEIITKHTTSKKDGTFHVGHASGTFHTANAYARGTTSSSNVSIQKDETALINELGEEMVVRDGKAMTFNNGYPVFANLKRGDIVFNHKFEICGLVQRCA